MKLTAEHERKAKAVLAMMMQLRPDLAKDFHQRPRFAPLLRFMAWALVYINKQRLRRAVRRWRQRHG